jgi:hypothetical protein
MPTPFTAAEAHALSVRDRKAALAKATARVDEFLIERAYAAIREAALGGLFSAEFYDRTDRSFNDLERDILCERLRQQGYTAYENISRYSEPISECRRMLTISWAASEVTSAAGAEDPAVRSS